MSWGENYNVVARINGKPASGLGLTGANATDTATAIKAKLAELQPYFPQGMKVVYPYDTTPFVKISIHEVVKTLLKQLFSSFLSCICSCRTCAQRHSNHCRTLLGTFAVLSMFGYSINTLTMFGMVLAIGLLVDDAIVVENVERVMVEEKLSPKKRRKIYVADPERWWVSPWCSPQYLSRWPFRRLNRRDLSSVFNHHRLRHGALRAGCAGTDSGALRHVVEASLS